MKCCRKCPHRGPLSDFGKSTKTADGHDYLCRSCRRETVQHNRHGGLMSAYREDVYPTRGDIEAHDRRAQRITRSMVRAIRKTTRELRPVWP